MDAHGRRVQTYVPEIVFAALEDPEERAYFNELPTSLSLDNEAVDRLIAAGRRLVRASPEFQRLLGALQADAGLPRAEGTERQCLSREPDTWNAALAVE